MGIFPAHLYQAGRRRTCGTALCCTLDRLSYLRRDTEQFLLEIAISPCDAAPGDGGGPPGRPQPPAATESGADRAQRRRRRGRMPPRLHLDHLLFGCRENRVAALSPYLPFIMHAHAERGHSSQHRKREKLSSSQSPNLPAG